LFKYKTVDLTEIVYSKHQMPDDTVKARLLAKVNEVKNDPRFFQYELGEGEMALQDRGWIERNEWLRRAIGWIRAADPNPAINGPESWVGGRPRDSRGGRGVGPQVCAIRVESRVP